MSGLARHTPGRNPNPGSSRDKAVRTGCPTALLLRKISGIRAADDVGKQRAGFLVAAAPATTMGEIVILIGDGGGGQRCWGKWLMRP